MATKKQIAANRRNAKKSTGPRTEDGKARAAQNATRHGLTARTLVLSDEDAAEFAELRDNLHEDLRPGSQLEVLLVNRIAAQQWRLARVPAIEAELLERLRADGVDELGLPDPALGAAWARDAGPYGGALARLARYEAALERSVLRLLAELRRLQAQRRRDEAATLAARAEARDTRPWPERGADAWPGAPAGPDALLAGATGHPPILPNEANGQPQGAAGPGRAGAASSPVT